MRSSPLASAECRRWHLGARCRHAAAGAPCRTQESGGCRTSLPFSPRPTRSSGDWWSAWGRAVVKQPALVLSDCATPLAARLAGETIGRDAPARQLKLRTASSPASAIGDLGRMERGGVVNSVRVLVEPPGDLLTAIDGRQCSSLAKLQSDPRIGESRRSPRRFRRLVDDECVRAASGPRPQIADVARCASDSHRRRCPRSAVDFTAISALVRELRGPETVRVAGLGGIRIRIGGIPALNVDYEDAISSRLVRTIALVIGLTLTSR